MMAIQVSSQGKKFNHLSIQDGLSQNTINCIHQDSFGFMWFGTQDGLNRYDGYGFTIFRHEPHDSNSLSHSWVWDIFEDSRQNLWIATWEGLNRYDPSADYFYRYLPDPSSPNKLHGGRPTSVCEDRQGYVWVATWGGGLSCYDPESGNFRTFRHDPENPESIPGDLVRTLHYDRDGILWIGTWNGLASCRPDSMVPTAMTIYAQDPGQTAGPGSNQITTLYKDKHGSLWIGTLGGGLHALNPGREDFRTYQHDPSDPRSIVSNEISAIYETSSGELWIGTVSSGLNILNRSDQSFDRYVHDPDREYSLGSNNIFSIREDASGLIYVGAGGINIYNPQMENFRHITYEPGQSGGISDKSIVAFYEDRNGFIWIGTGAGGLNRYDPVRNSFKVFRHHPSNPHSLNHNNVSSIAGDSNGFIWIGTRGGGLDRLDPETGIFKHYMSGNAPHAIQGTPYINGLLVDEGNDLWIATYDRGLIHFDPSENSHTHYRSIPEDNTTLSGDYLLRIFQDGRKQIWIGTWGAGLSLYQSDKDQFLRFLHDPSDPHSLCDNMVHVIHETTNDTGRIIWVGTSGGLSYFDPDTGPDFKFNHINQSDGLPSNVIYGILEDGSGHLWISTNNGLCRYHHETRSFKNYDVHDGLQSNEFNAGACIKLENKQLLFGGVNGFNSFHPDRITTSRYAPPIVLTSFQIFNEPVAFNQALNTVQRIELAYRENFFSFEFSALDFSKPHKNQYKYKMEGIDPDWVNSETRRYASYTKIPPGEYEFFVTGTNSEGIWSSDIKTVQIHIATPYWQTWWFQLILIFIFFLILYALHRFRIRKLIEMERLRLRIASDLHDDVGSALTRIVIHSEQVQSNPDHATTALNLSRIASISREVITTMSDIIWSIDSRHDSVGDMIDRMLDFSYNTLSLKDIRFEFHHDGLDKSRKIPVDYRQNIYYIFKEALNNIVRHAEATEVKIQLKNEKHAFRMVIIDNGRGFNEDIESRGHGLKNMKMRAERIDGRLDIIVNQGVGIILQMPHL
jgi:ligand-binding sensor domain-containing protein